MTWAMGLKTRLGCGSRRTLLFIYVMPSISKLEAVMSLIAIQKISLHMANITVQISLGVTAYRIHHTGTPIIYLT